MTELIFHPWMGSIANGKFENEMGNETTEIVSTLRPGDLDHTVTQLTHMHCIMNDYVMLRKNVGIWDPDNKKAFHVNFVYASEGVMHFTFIFIQRQYDSFKEADAMSIVDEVCDVIEKKYHVTSTFALLKINLSGHIEEIQWVE